MPIRNKIRGGFVAAAIGASMFGALAAPAIASAAPIATDRVTYWHHGWYHPEWGPGWNNGYPAPGWVPPPGWAPPVDWVPPAG